MKIVLGTMTFSDQVTQTVANEMVKLFREKGYEELDTAYVYNDGETEKLLGRLYSEGKLEGCTLAGKANPAIGDGLTPKSVTQQLTESLGRLELEDFDLFYLHMPDLNTPIRDTLACIDEHHRAGRFSRFGLSNYAAWQVAEIVELCRQNDWVQPTVYQGMYNALTRDVERELLACLANYNMSFYVYNPLAGGMLTGKHLSVDTVPDDGRFASIPIYQDRYWKPDLFRVVGTLVEACKKHDISPASAAIRWLNHHSALADNDQNAIIIGASSLSHLEQNLDACSEGPLPDNIVNAMNEGWEQVRPVCIKYFRP